MKKITTFIIASVLLLCFPASQLLAQQDPGCNTNDCQLVANGDFAAFDQAGYTNCFNTNGCTNAFCIPAVCGGGFPQTFTPCWHASHGSGNVTATFSAAMWAAGNSGEGIFQNIDALIPGRQYILSFDAQMLPTTTIPTEALMVELVTGLGGSCLCVGGSAIPAPTLIQGPLYNNPENNPAWTHHDVCFIANAATATLGLQLWIYPDRQGNGTPATASWVDIDNVRIQLLPNVSPIVTIACEEAVVIGPPCEPPPGATFLWTPATGLSPSATVAYPTASPAISTVYSLLVTTADGLCSYNYQVSVIVDPPCCFAEVDPLYVHALPYYGPGPGTVVWDGKYYVNGTVIIDGITLDISVVDVVFDECAEIRFINGAMLRANNSVFRPCNPNEHWQGLTFESTAGRDNIINENTFKNANIALDFTDLPDAKITNNLFYNCGTGISLTTCYFNYPISGNHFEIDLAVPSFTGCDIGPAGYYGINSKGTYLTYPISQNEFVNGDNWNVNYYGITLSQSFAQVTENTFTDMFESVGISAPTYSNTVENNEMEIIRNMGNNLYQIVVNDALVPTFIFDNKIIDSNDDPGLPFAAAGIYAARSLLVTARGNEIKGFRSGIEFHDMALSQAIENHILDAVNFGIYVANSSDISIGCNVIDFDDFFNTVGIEFYFVDELSHIYSNCIFDSQTGIDLQSPDGAIHPIQVIENNYIYNYTMYGIYSLNLTGFIGTAFATPGKNTLYSNYAAAVDIGTASLTPGFITAIGNWLSVVTVPAVVTNFNSIYSNASCGNQIYAQPSQPNLDPYLTCDDFNEADEIMGYDGEKFMLVDGYIQVLSESHSGNLFELILAVQNALSSNADNSDADEFNQAVNESSWINPQQKAWVNYYYELNTQDSNQSASFLAQIIPANADEQDLWNIETIRMNQVQGLYPNAVIDEFGLEILRQIAEAARMHSNTARMLLWGISDGYPFVFEDVVSPVYVHLPSLSLNQNLVEVHPNPATDQLILTLVAKEKVTIHLNDIMGREIKFLEFQDQSGEMKVDISGLSKGVYFIAAIDESNQYIQRIKFMKQ